MNNASRGQNTLRVYTILLQGKQPKTTASPGQYYNCFSCKGNLVVKYCIGCICCFLFIPFLVLCYYPNPPFFRMIHFCARRDVDCCALYHGISSSYSTQIFTIFTSLFTKLALGPILLMMINVSINDD